MPVHAKLSVNVYPSLYEMRHSLRFFVMTPPRSAASPSCSSISQTMLLRARTAKECNVCASSNTNDNLRIPGRYTPEMVFWPVAYTCIRDGWFSHAWKYPGALWIEETRFILKISKAFSLGKERGLGCFSTI